MANNERVLETEREKETVRARARVSVRENPGETELTCVCAGGLGLQLEIGQRDQGKSLRFEVLSPLWKQAKDSWEKRSLHRE